MSPEVLKELIADNPSLKKKIMEEMPEKKTRVDEDPVSFVKVQIGYKSGTVTHEVREEEYSIDALSYTLDKKNQKVKSAEGEFLGFEPTGEYILTIKVKYTKPQ